MGVVALALALIVIARPAQATTRVPRSFFGVQSWDLRPFQFTQRTAGELTRMEKAGVSMLRVSTAPFMPLAAADPFIAAAARHHIRVIFVLGDGRWNPDPGPTHGATPPRSFHRLARYAAALVHRYGPRGAFWNGHPRLRRYAVRTWQIWNEPNLPVYWLPRPSPRAYARAVRVVARAIHHADRRATVVTAGLPDSRQSRPLPVLKYLARFLRAGGWRWVQAVAINGYAPTVGDFRRELRSYRRTMNAHHGRRLKMLITEVGWADRGHRNPMVVGRRRQARNITRMYRMLARLRHRWHILGAFYFQWRDIPVLPGNYHGNTWGYHTGLLRVDQRPKPAFGAYRRVVRSLTGHRRRAKAKRPARSASGATRAQARPSR